MQELHPALHVLQERLRCGSKPGARQDSYKLGLAVEGGGMRGSVTAGALRALHDLGVRWVGRLDSLLAGGLHVWV